MVATFPVMEQFSDVLGINEFQHLSVPVQLGFTGVMFVSEFTSMLKSFCQAISIERRLPGDLGFGVWDPTNGELMDKELNNGRLGMMVQELVTNQPLF